VSDRVAVVILTWNGREDTLACLESLAAVTYPELDVVLVDNASADGTESAVAERHPHVRILRQERNTGFAGGVNAGARHALETMGADHLLLLNNDTVVDPGFVEPLVDLVRERTDAAAACSKVLFADRPDHIWFAGAPLHAERGYDGRLRGWGELDSPAYGDVTVTDRASATSMLVPRAAWERIGPLDDSFFAYAEDVDWSLRAREHGLRVYVQPHSRIWHRVSASSGGEGAPNALYYSVRNGLRARERHAVLGRAATARRRAVFTGAHLLQAVRSPRRREAIAAVVAGYRDFRAGRSGPRPS
jgi:GT2 family glycosyltransferase